MKPVDNAIRLMVEEQDAGNNDGAPQRQQVWPECDPQRSQNLFSRAYDALFYPYMNKILRISAAVSKSVKVYIYIYIYMLIRLLCLSSFTCCF